MTKIAVVDNSSSAAERMRSFLQRYQEQHNTIFQISVFPDGAKLMEDYKPIYDIIFLDIEMPGKDGMTTAREIREIDQDVILVFVTRMAQYAVDGYRVRALDYLVKPINYSAFEMRMNLLLERLPSREEKDCLFTAGGCVLPDGRIDLSVCYEPWPSSTDLEGSCPYRIKLLYLRSCLCGGFHCLFLDLLPGVTV